MAKFTLRAIDTNTKAERQFVYDNQTSSLTEGGVPVIPVTPTRFASASVVGKDAPGKKTSSVKVLKISLGLNCNYECSYCSQRFVPRADASNPDDIEPFLKSLLENVKGAPDKIEFWGGEPFVYWKTFKPLAERLRELYPYTRFSVITNGSLLDGEKLDWLDKLGFAMAISHDGPGYHVRGLDPLDDPEKAKWIYEAYRRFAPSGRISINAMMHSGNRSRAEVQEWFAERFGGHIQIGEGSMVDPYDEGGMASMLKTYGDHIDYRNETLMEMREGRASDFGIVDGKVRDFIYSIQSARPASAVGQKCGMDKSDNLAVDLFGNVLTCQNVSIKGVAPNGESHHIGNLSDLGAVAMKTSTHWSKRSECPNCPVLQVCQGSCMYLDGPLWDAGCDNSFSDNITFFAAAIEAMTGCLLYYIDGPQREDRRDIFGAVNGKSEPTRHGKKVIPIVAA